MNTFTAMMSRDTLDYLLTMYFRQLQQISDRESLELDRIMFEGDEVEIQGIVQERKLDG